MGTVYTNKEVAVPAKRVEGISSEESMKEKASSMDDKVP